MHFGFSGLPDRWENTQGLNWFLLPVIAVALTLFIYSVRLLIRRWPELINFPTEKQRKAFFALAPEQREPIFRIFENFILWMAVPINLLWLIIQMSTYLVATGVWKGLPPYLLPVFIAIILGTAVMLYFRLDRAMAKELQG